MCPALPCPAAYLLLCVYGTYKKQQAARKARKEDKAAQAAAGLSDEAWAAKKQVRCHVVRCACARPTRRHRAGDAAQWTAAALIQRNCGAGAVLSAQTLNRVSLPHKRAGMQLLRAATAGNELPSPMAQPATPDGTAP